MLVSNHPNTLIDVVLSGIFARRKVHFLANAGLFKTPLNRWFFTLLFCIPITRRQDSKGQKVNNKHTFSRSTEFLKSGGCLYIAPEGSSWVERHLRRLKTGAARIGISTESESDFSIGLKVLPLGLSYSNQQAFQSSVYLSFGAPLSVVQYKDLADQHQRKAVQQLTKDISTSLENEMIHTTDQYEDWVSQMAVNLLSNSKKLEVYEQFRGHQAMIRAVRALRETDEPTFRDLYIQMQQYQQLLSLYQLKDEDILKTSPKWYNWLFLLIGFPFFIYGYLNHFLLYQMTYWVNRQFNDDPTYDSTYKFLSLWLGFPLFYGLQTWLVMLISGNSSIGWLYLISLYPLGLFSNYYWHLASTIRSWWRRKRASRRNPHTLIGLIQSRESLKKSFQEQINSQ